MDYEGFSTGDDNQFPDIGSDPAQGYADGGGYQEFQQDPVYQQQDPVGQQQDPVYQENQQDNQQQVDPTQLVGGQQEPPPQPANQQPHRPPAQQQYQQPPPPQGPNYHQYQQPPPQGPNYQQYQRPPPPQQHQQWPPQPANQQYNRPPPPANYQQYQGQPQPNQQYHQMPGNHQYQSSPVNQQYQRPPAIPQYQNPPVYPVQYQTPSPVNPVIQMPPGQPLNNYSPAMTPGNYNLAPVTTGAWSTDLFDCFNDVPLFCMTCWCPCFTFGQVAEIVDKGSSTCGTTGSLYALILFLTGCQFIYSGSYRTKMRHQYGIPGDDVEDFCTHLWCESCALVQEQKELTLRGYDVPLGWHGNMVMASQKQSQGVQMAPMAQNGMTR